MKQLLLVLFIVVVAANLAFAGTPMTAKGDKSLGFWVNGLGDFDLSGVHAAGGLDGISFKYFLSQDMALRANAAFGTSTTKTPVGTTGDNENTSTGIALRPGLIWHCPPVAGAISPYWGIEGSFGWVKNSFKPAGGGAESSNSGTVFGAGVLLGAEWWAWDGISFNAEYNLGFTSTSTKSEAGGTSTDGPSMTAIGIDWWTVGLNVYLGGAQ
jgi:opacity protein-like surface antigen